MTRARLVRLVSWVAVVALVGLLGRPVMGEPTAAEKKTTPAVEKGAKVAAASAEKQKSSERKRSSHRLPAYYSGVVDPQQRAKIYQIQDEYDPKLTTLKAQLEALTAERDEKVVAVLSEEQRAKVEGMKAETKNKRSAKSNGQPSVEGAGAQAASTTAK